MSLLPRAMLNWVFGEKEKIFTWKKHINTYSNTNTYRTYYMVIWNFHQFFLCLCTTYLPTSFRFLSPQNSSDILIIFFFRCLLFVVHCFLPGHFQRALCNWIACARCPCRCVSMYVWVPTAIVETFHYSNSHLIRIVAIRYTICAFRHKFMRMKLENQSPFANKATFFVVCTGLLHTASCTVCVWFVANFWSRIHCS